MGGGGGFGILEGSHEGGGGAENSIQRGSHKILRIT